MATKMKTGGMVNANANLQAGKTAGSKGVRSGVNPKAIAQGSAKGRVGGTSVAPKTAIPKKALGGATKPGYTKTGSKKYQDGGPMNSPETQIKRAMIKTGFNNARAMTKARGNKPNGKI